MATALDSNRKTKHNASAPYWAAALIILCLTGLLTVWTDLGSFWKGYVLDMAGPAWSYILFRGLFTEYKENKWTQFFTPKRTYIIFVITCFGIEMMQYFEIYHATFDPFDLLAYISILTPLFIIDSKIYTGKPKASN